MFLWTCWFFVTLFLINIFSFFENETFILILICSLHKYICSSMVCCILHSRNPFLISWHTIRDRWQGKTIDQNIRQSRLAKACRNYADFLFRLRLLTIRLLEQGYVVTRLESPLQKFNGRHHKPVDRYGVSIWPRWSDLFNMS